MCGVCGCGSKNKTVLTDMQSGEAKTVETTTPAHFHVQDDGSVQAHTHAYEDCYGHEHSHNDHSHNHPHSDYVHSAYSPAFETAGLHVLGQAVLAKNDRIALENAALFQKDHLLVMNIISSPGAGKTSLLERTIKDLGQKIPIAVIEGDQATLNDADRIQKAGAPSVQINTGSGCHLEADMVAEGLKTLKPLPYSVVFIENVGNLVCPALFDLGEKKRIVLLSVTEGEDKPLKYPQIFQSADVLLLNKTDLLPYLPTYNLAKCEEAALSVKPDLQILKISTLTEEGMQPWYEWLGKEVEKTASGQEEGHFSQALKR